MKFSQLIKGIENQIISAKIDKDPDIKGIIHNSKQVKDGYIFVAIKGRQVDGHRFIEEAIKKGAVALIVEKGKDYKVPYIIVKNARKVMGKLACRLYGYPSRRLKLTGITGTNGKTTTAYLTYQLLNSLNFPAGLIGTIFYDDLNFCYPANRTTPESVELAFYFNNIVKAGGKACVMEVSSAGIEEGRVNDFHFSIGVFLNFSREHLEYHGTLQAYFNAKKKLFTELKPEIGIFNADEPKSYEIIKEFKGRSFLFSLKDPVADIYARVSQHSLTHIELNIIKPFNRSFLLPFGLLHNAYNFLAAFSILHVLDLSDKLNQDIVNKLSLPKGRMEWVRNNKDYQVFIDYAHTPEALNSLLRTVKSYVKGRLIVVFGAGGDRDKGKRPLMGEAVSRYADLPILTSDNPRSEDPLKIIEDVLKGMHRGKTIIEPDRREAIRKAIEILKAEDVLIIAGKGHETYQEIKGKRYPFDDYEVAREFLKEVKDAL